MATVTDQLNVEGMSCSHCEASVKKAVGGLSGVDSVEVDLKGKRVTVKHDPEKTSLSAIAEAIEDQGYEVKR